MLPQGTTTQDVTQLSTSADTYLRCGWVDRLPDLNLKVVTQVVKLGMLERSLTIDERIDVRPTCEADKISISQHECDCPILLKEHLSDITVTIRDVNLSSIGYAIHFSSP
jgi:hypothetical protein